MVTSAETDKQEEQKEAGGDQEEEIRLAKREY